MLGRKARPALSRIWSDGVAADYSSIDAGTWFGHPRERSPIDVVQPELSFVTGNPLEIIDKGPVATVDVACLWRFISAPPSSISVAAVWRSRRYEPGLPMPAASRHSRAPSPTAAWVRAGGGHDEEQRARIAARDQTGAHAAA